MMNQIIQERFEQNKNDNIYKYDRIKNNRINKNIKFDIELSDEIAEIPYGGNFTISMSSIKNNKLYFIKNFVKKRKYQLQFLFSATIATIFLIFLFWKLYQNQQQEKIAKELLNNYQLTTLYSNDGQYQADKAYYNITGNPFVIGMIKIDKIQLSYPILSESNDDLLKISLCRFTGPMPNEIGNLCIAGHNYIDNRFFGRLSELENGDLIEIYGLSGEKQEYYVFQKYEVEANDLSCTSQEVDDSKIVTLLTCNNSSNNKRLIVKAKESK